jgi:hypothetical protein
VQTLKLINMNRYICCLLFLLQMHIVSKDAWGGGISANATLLNAISKKVKNYTNYSYLYKVKNTYPNDQFNEVKGKVYLDVTKKCIYEVSKYSTTLLNEHWYYKAEHESKTVEIVNLSHKGMQNQIQELYQSFSNGVQFLVDSNFIKAVKDISKEGSLIKVTMNSDLMDYVDKYVIYFYSDSYDMASIYMKVIYPSYGGNSIQEISVSEINNNVNVSDVFSTAPLFEFRSGKVELKKHKGYKTNYKL